MHNIDHLKRLIGSELEALVEEVNSLKQRVHELEHQRFHASISENKEFIGKWLQQQPKQSSTVSCNMSAMI